MTATEIVKRVRAHGGDIELLPDGHRLVLVHRRSIPDDLAAMARLRAADLRALLAEQSAATATDTVLAAQRLLRDGLWPATPGVCDFLIGRNGEDCKRCRASWYEHYPRPRDGDDAHP